ncbi:MAG: hypothetical protein ACPGYT_14990 [Nitrospirales bacterium]
MEQEQQYQATKVNERQVNYKTEDRQWDARINVQTDEYLDTIVDNIKKEHAAGKFRYILIGGVEVGTRPNQTDYKIRHVHIAAVFNNRCSQASILKNWGIQKGNGFYLVPRNRALPYSGWRSHHIKDYSKVDVENKMIFEAGDLPKDIKQKTIYRSEEEKKRKVDDILIEMRDMITNNQEEECFKKFPRNYITYGSRLKAMVAQKRNFFGVRTDPNIYVYGFPGTGKTAIMQFLYPKMYKKDLSNRFFDLYDQDFHSHIMLEDMDPQNVEKLGVQFLKTLCDEGGFPIDQKYKTPQLAHSTILVTSNYDIQHIVPHDADGAALTVTALMRRFYHVRIDNLLRLLSLKLIGDYDRKRLKREGNRDPSKLFMTYDYVQDCPKGMPLEPVEHYQTLIIDDYYK